MLLLLFDKLLLLMSTRGHIDRSGPVLMSSMMVVITGCGCTRSPGVLKTQKDVLESLFTMSNVGELEKEDKEEA